MKLTVVGCGPTSTPALVAELAALPLDLGLREIALVDPDSRRLGTLAAAAQSRLDAAGHPATVTTTPELERGAADADVVLLRIDVGGAAARHSDRTFPLAHGCVGHDTVGAGGIARALRTVPVALDIADRVRAVAADGAWLVNATGPLGVVTRALVQQKHRVLGVGGSGAAFQPWVAQHLGVPADVVVAQHLGVTQVHWVRNVIITGPNASMDVLPALLASQADEVAEHVGLPAAVLHRTGAVPGYWLKYFYRHDEIVAAQREAESSSPDEAVGSAEPDSSGLASEAADTARMIGALTGGAPAELVVTTRNSGLLPFLPQDAMVEAPALVDGQGARTLPALPLPPALSGLMAHVTAAEDQTLTAAREGNRDAVADALLAHPLIGRPTLAEQLTDALLEENADYLPWVKD